MDRENRRNLSISGIGSSSGGEFHNVKIDGIGTLNSACTCTSFIVNGKASVQGPVHAARTEINGTASIEGNVLSDRFSLHGKVNVNGDVKGENMQWHGMATVIGLCEAETFDANGKLQLGMLNAGSIQITLNGSSQIGEIGGGRIQVRKQPGIDFAKWLKVLPIPFGNKLTAQTIEGDDIYIEYTTAQVVRGTNVSIGPGCDIGLVEYKGKFDRHGEAQVKKSEKM